MTKALTIRGLRKCLDKELSDLVGRHVSWLEIVCTEQGGKRIRGPHVSITLRGRRRVTGEVRRALHALFNRRLGRLKPYRQQRSELVSGAGGTEIGISFDFAEEK